MPLTRPGGWGYPPSCFRPHYVAKSCRYLFQKSRLCFRSARRQSQLAIWALSGRFCNVLWFVHSRARQNLEGVGRIEFLRLYKDSWHRGSPSSGIAVCAFGLPDSHPFRPNFL